MDRVTLRCCGSYDAPQLAAVIKTQLDALGVCNELKPGMTAVLKPNLIMKSKPEENIITHPAVIEAVGLYMKACGAEVLIAESPGGPNSPAVMNSVYRACGYTEMAERNGFSLYTACKSREVFLPNAVKCKKLSVLEPFLDADYIINIPKMKTHGMMGMSGAVKNLFGVVPGLMKPELHCRFPDKSDFADMLLDLCDFIRPHLSVMDAVYGMQGNGPTGGESRFVGAVLASKNPYSLDLAAAEIMNIKADEVFLLKNAISRKLSPEALDETEIMGDAIHKIRVTDYKRAKASSVDFIDRAPRFLRSFLTKIATPKPRIRTSECIGCGKCAESCPQHIIEMLGTKAVIRLQDCISCFCCHEMCPQHVIDIKRLGVFKL